MKRRSCRNRRVDRWKRAVEIAKFLFEDQGYHSRYLDDLLAFALDAVESEDIDRASERPSTKTPNRRRTHRCT